MSCPLALIGPVTGPWWCQWWNGDAVPDAGWEVECEGGEGRFYVQEEERKVKVRERIPGGEGYKRGEGVVRERGCYQGRGGGRGRERRGARRVPLRVGGERTRGSCATEGRTGCW